MRAWRPLLAVALAYRLLSVVLLVPAAGALLRGFLWLAGSAAIADQDIAGFLATPLGLAAVVVMGAVGLSIFVLEQACLMAVARGAPDGQPATARAALGFVAARLTGIVQLAVRVVVRVLLTVAPLAAALGALYWLLLSGHDINFYLAERPPRFLVAAALAALMSTVAAALLAWRLLAWLFAVPLLLFGRRTPAAALRLSSEHFGAHWRVVVTTMAFWGVMALVAGGLPLAVVVALGEWLVPWSRESMAALVATMGALLTLWSLLGLALGVAIDAALAVLVMRLYRHAGGVLEVAPGPTHLPRRETTLSGRRLLVAAAAGAVASLVVGLLLLDGVRTEDQALVIAHRGASAEAPENSLAAVRLAIEQGAEYVEIDVQESRDGQVVVVHDADLMRIGRTPLPIWSTDAAELRSVDVGSFFAPEFSAERLPLLEEVLTLCRDRARVVIELKFYGREERLEERVIEVVERLQMQEQVSVMSLKGGSVNKMKSLRPDWNIGLLTAVAIGDITRLPADFLAVNFRIATASFVRRAHAAGKPVWVWTVNDGVNMSRLLSLGVDGLITDYPTRAREVLAERADLNSAERLLLSAALWVGLDPPHEPPVEADAPAGTGPN